MSDHSLKQGETLEISFTASRDDVLSLDERLRKESWMQPHNNIIELARREGSYPDTETYFLAKKGGLPVGAAAMRVPDGDTESFELHKLYVLPEQRQKKIGESIVDFVINFMAKENYETMHVDVNPDAQGFWRKMQNNYITDPMYDTGNHLAFKVQNK